MNVILIRHGATAGNLEKRYIGKTDEPLSASGIADLKRKTFPDSTHLIASPAKRCLETCAILFPTQKPVICSSLRECDFGDFEGKNHTDLNGDAYYQAWIDSHASLPFPHGESPQDFKNRCKEAFQMLMSGLDGDVTFVIHGGTIMAICETFHGGEFYSYHVPNGGGFRADWDGSRLSNLEKL